MIFSLCGAVLLTSCNPPSPTATDEEKQAAQTARVACPRNAARKLDDGKSDATTIAVAMHEMCVAEYMKSIEVFTRFLDNDQFARQEFAARELPGEIRLATMIILELRKASPVGER